MNLGSGPLLACTSYAIDLVVTSCLYNGWKVGLLSHHLAQKTFPELAETLLFAGLLHDIGAVGMLDTHDRQKMTNVDVLSQAADYGAKLVRLVPGLQLASDCIRYMYKPYESVRAGDDQYSESVFIGSQILRLADTMDAIGLFCNKSDASKITIKYNNLEKQTGHSWSNEIWNATKAVVQDKDFCAMLSNTNSLTHTLTTILSEAQLPKRIDNDKGNHYLLDFMSSLVDRKDHSTIGHSKRVAKAAVQLAVSMGLSKEDAYKLYYACLIHDLGKLGIPSKIINISARLHTNEISLVKLHANATLSTIACIPECKELIEIGTIGAHDHEFFNGKGYPDGLSGNDIPLLSRMLAVVDSYDAMITQRNFRILTPRAALVRIKQGSGSQFDPAVVEKFVGLLESRDNDSEFAEAC